MNPDDAMQNALSVLEEACLATEKDKAPGNAKLVWMTVQQVADAGEMSVDDAEAGLRRGVQEELISEGKGDNEGKYALNDPDLNTIYTA